MGPVTVRRRGTAFLLLAGMAALFAVFVALTGGIDTRNARQRSRSSCWHWAFSSSVS
jgi:hypothetical protein